MEDQHIENRAETPAGSMEVMEGYLSRVELAAKIGVSVDTLRRWATQRKGPPCIYVGRTPYYRIEAYREWLLSQEKKTWGGRR